MGYSQTSMVTDLYFLFHSFGVQIIPFKTKNLFEGKKDIAKNIHKAPRGWSLRIEFQVTLNWYVQYLTR